MRTAALSPTSSTDLGPRWVRLLVVDDHPVVRSGIAGMVSSEADLVVVGEAADGEQAVDCSYRRLLLRILFLFVAVDRKSVV